MAGLSYVNLVNDGSTYFNYAVDGDEDDGAIYRMKVNIEFDGIDNVIRYYICPYTIVSEKSAFMDSTSGIYDFYFYSMGNSENQICYTTYYRAR